MAALIKDKYKNDVALIKSSGGVFEVRRDGKMIFSKKNLGRFPEALEIFEKLG